MLVKRILIPTSSMSNHSSETDSEKTPATQEAWNQIQEDLKSALSAWSELAPKATEKELSPEARKLSEMKMLLADLKAKIRDFEDL